MNMKNASLIQPKGEQKKDNISKKKKVDGGKKGVLKEYVALTNIVGDCIRIEEDFGSNWCEEKDRRL